MLYIKRALIKVGAYGKIFETTDKSVVAKTLSEKSDDFELSILQDLKHDNIVQVCGVDCEDRTVYMEALKINLSEFMFTKTYGWKEIRFIIRQLTEVLVFLQDRKIVHFDIKASNIMIDPDTLHVKIIDFGLAKVIEEPQNPGRRGTLSYMAPEVLFNKLIGPVNSVDVWSLMILLYRLVTKESLFESDYNRFDTETLSRSVTEDPTEQDVVRYLKMLSYYVDYMPKDLMGPLDSTRSNELTRWQLKNTGSTCFDGLKKRLFTKSILSLRETQEVYELLKFGLVIDPTKRPLAAQLFSKISCEQKQ